MKIPKMEWIGWFTVILPFYVLIASVLGYIFKEEISTYEIQFETILVLLLVIMIAAISLSIFGYLYYKKWNLVFVVPLIVIDLVFISLTLVLFGKLFNSISLNRFLMGISIYGFVIFAVNYYLLKTNQLTDL